MFNILTTELSNVGFLSSHQYGFREGRGTGNALAAAISTWHQTLEAGGDVAVIIL